jgi:hypothetical protein
MNQDDLIQFAIKNAIDASDISILRNQLKELNLFGHSWGILVGAVLLKISKNNHVIITTLNKKKCEIKGGIYHLSSTEKKCLEYAYNKFKDGIKGLWGTPRITVEFISNTEFQLKRSNEKELNVYFYKFL